MPESICSWRWPESWNCNERSKRERTQRTIPAISVTLIYKFIIRFFQHLLWSLYEASLPSSLISYAPQKFETSPEPKYLVSVF